MIKGCRKRMVIVSGLNDSSIEAAYFVMKDDTVQESFNENDILKKANSLIANCDTETFRISSKGQKRRARSAGKSHHKSLFSFFAGFISGGILAAMIAFIVFA